MPHVWNTEHLTKFVSEELGYVLKSRDILYNFNKDLIFSLIRDLLVRQMILIFKLWIIEIRLTSNHWSVKRHSRNSDT